MDALGKALVELELEGLDKARKQNPGVIIRDDGDSFKLLLKGSTMEEVAPLIVQKNRDLRPKSAITEEPVEGGVIGRIFFGKKRLPVGVPK